MPCVVLLALWETIKIPENVIHKSIVLICLSYREGNISVPQM